MHVHLWFESTHSVKYPKRWQPYRCLDTQKYCTCCHERYTEHVVMNGTRNMLSWTVHGTCCHERYTEHVVMNSTWNMLSWTVHGTCCHERYTEHVVMNGTRNMLSWTVHGTCCHAVVAAVASPNLNFPQTLNKVCAYLLTELSSLKLQQAFSHEYSTNIIQDNTMPERQTFSYSSSLKKIVVTDRLSFFIFCLCVGSIFFNLNIDFAVILLLVVSAKTVDIAVITLAKSKELSLGDNTMHSLCIVCIRESNVCKGFAMFLIYERKFLLWNWLT